MKITTPRVLAQKGSFQFCTDDKGGFFRHRRGHHVWYRIPERCRPLKVAAFRTLRGTV